MNLYEFIGIMIGDGCLLYYPKHRIYGIEITGNAIEEKDYYEKISKFMQGEFNLKPRIYVRSMTSGKGLKLISYNKNLANYLLKLGIKGNKTYNVKIPKNLLCWDKSKHIIRGIFETDGSLYFSRSKITIKEPSYPRLEITTVSYELADQIVQILSENGFSVQCHMNRSAIVIYMSGENMLNKWIQDIGFSSDKNWSKYLLWKELGYYIPRISLPERISLLRVRGQTAKIGSEDLS